MSELKTYYQDEDHFQGECNGLEIEIRPELFRPENPRWFIEISQVRGVYYWDSYFGLVNENPIDQAITFAKSIAEE